MQSLITFDEIEAYLHAISGINNAFISQKIENKMKKNVMIFFKSSRQFLIKFNDIEYISKQLTTLISRF